MDEIDNNGCMTAISSKTLKMQEDRISIATKLQEHCRDHCYMYLQSQNRFRRHVQLFPNNAERVITMIVPEFHELRIRVSISKFSALIMAEKTPLINQF